MTEEEAGGDGFSGLLGVQTWARGRGHLGNVLWQALEGAGTALCVLDLSGTRDHSLPLDCCEGIRVLWLHACLSSWVQRWARRIDEDFSEVSSSRMQSSFYSSDLLCQRIFVISGSLQEDAIKIVVQKEKTEKVIFSFATGFF